MPKISCIYQDKKSNLWYFVANLGADENGNRIRHWERGFRTQKECKIAYDKYMNDYSKTSVKLNSTMSFEEFYETYFKPHYRQSVRLRTYENRISSMDKHFAFFYNKKLKDINTIMIKRWQNELYEKYSQNYVRNVFGMLERCLDLANKLELLQHNQARKVGNVKKEKVKVEFWSKGEFTKVVSTFDRDDYYDNFAFITIWFLFMTGLRFGELQALEWDTDLDLENGLVRITKSMYYQNSEKFICTPPKTKKSIRTIALDNDTIQYLKIWKEEQQKNIISKFVFSYNGIPTNKHTVRKLIETHSKLAEVNKINVHALRHSHASLLISLGENPLIIRDRLGHEDIETTLGTYGHLYENVHREVATRLNNLIEITNNQKVDRKKISNQYIKR